jgi:hypothetical protein
MDVDDHARAESFLMMLGDGVGVRPVTGHVGRCGASRRLPWRASELSASGHRREPTGGVVHHGARESLPTTARDQPGGPLIATTTTGRHIGVPGSIRRLTVGLDRPRGK